MLESKYPHAIVFDQDIIVPSQVRKTLNFTGIVNFRDVGESVNSLGSKVGFLPGILFRSAHLARLSDEQKQQLSDYGITDVIDLRFGTEVTAGDDVDILPEKINYHAVEIDTKLGDLAYESLQQVVNSDGMPIIKAGAHSLSGNVSWEGKEVDKSEFLYYAYASMREMYKIFVSDQVVREQFGKALQIIANSPATLIHCRSGKDRTGWLTALVLFIVGVEPEIIMQDYLLSGLYNDYAAKQLEKDFSTGDWKMFTPFATVYPQYIRETMREVMKLYAKDLSLDIDINSEISRNVWKDAIMHYLGKCNVTDEIIDKIRTKYHMDCVEASPDDMSQYNISDGENQTDSQVAQNVPYFSDVRPDLVVLAGPTAVGKGTVSRLLNEHYNEIYLSVSATTREPREGEVEGVHYHFTSKQEFEKSINDGEFLEWAVVHGMNFYGTLKQPIRDANKRGQTALLEIDLQGARKVRELLAGDNSLNAKFIFLAPPTFEELITRLGMRGTESREEREKRLETAREEIAAQDEFDYVVINDEIDQAVEEIAEIIGLK